MPYEQPRKENTRLSGKAFVLWTMAGLVFVLLWPVAHAVLDLSYFYISPGFWSGPHEDGAVAVTSGDSVGSDLSGGSKPPKDDALETDWWASQAAVDTNGDAERTGNEGTPRGNEANAAAEENAAATPTKAGGKAAGKKESTAFGLTQKAVASTDEGATGAGEHAARDSRSAYQAAYPGTVPGDPAIEAIIDRLIARREFVDLHADSILRMARRRQDMVKEYPKAEVDIPKLRRAGIGLQFLSICSPPPKLRPSFRTWKDFSFIRYFKEVMRSHKDLENATTASQARKIMAEGKIATVLSLEGAGVLLNDPGRLKTLYEGGMRSIGPVWNITNTLADSARDDHKWGGLSPVGRKVIQEMNHLGIMVDVSHASEEAFWDIMEVSSRPVFASHSNAYALRAHSRNLKDDQIRAIAARGGVIGVAFHRTFLMRGRGPATIDHVVAHIRHIAKVGGIGCVAIGTDFGGGAILPVGLSNMGELRNLIRALLIDGFSESDVRRIMGGNAMRYFETMCP